MATLFNRRQSPVTFPKSDKPPEIIHRKIVTVTDSRLALFSDGGAKRISKVSYNWLNRFLQISGQPASIVYMGGVSGDRTDQLIARAPVAAGTPGATDAFLQACVNNITQAPYTHSITGETIPLEKSGIQSFTDMVGMINIFRALNIRVFVIEESGIDSTWPGSTWTAAMSAQVAIFNAKMEAFCRNLPNVYFVQFPNILDKSTAGHKHKAKITYDSTHFSTGGSWFIADDFKGRYGPLFPPAVSLSVNPATSAYSGDVEAPIQLLNNPGFATRTGGQLNAGAATITDWAGTTVVAAKAFNKNGGNIYYTAAGGTTGSTAPTHTSGTASDGGVQWTFIMSATNSLPANWYTAVGNGGTYCLGTNVTSDNTIEIVMIVFFTQGGATPSNVGIVTDVPTARQSINGKYSLRSRIQVDAQTNLGATMVQWNRGDMSVVPQDGYGAAAMWTDTQGNFTNDLINYPLVEYKATDPFTAESQSTPGGVATWNSFKCVITGAGAGFAIVRIRDCSMVRTS